MIRYISLFTFLVSLILPSLNPCVFFTNCNAYSFKPSVSLEAKPCHGQKQQTKNCCDNTPELSLSCSCFTFTQTGFTCFQFSQVVTYLKKIIDPFHSYFIVSLESKPILRSSNLSSSLYYSTFTDIPCFLSNLALLI
jgi:hypothetical protein